MSSKIDPLGLITEMANLQTEMKEYGSYEIKDREKSAK